MASTPRPQASGRDYGPAFDAVPKFEPIRPRKGNQHFRLTTKYMHQRSEGLRGKRGLA